MPKYTFKCTECDWEESLNMSMTAFLAKKKERKECSNCLEGVLSHQVGTVRSVVDRHSSEIIAEIKEDVRKTVKKIRAGDTHTINSIYGDTPNPYKNRR